MRVTHGAASSRTCLPCNAITSHTDHQTSGYSESILAIVIPSFVIYIVRQSIKAYPQGWPLTTASTTLASRGDKMTSQQTSASVNASQWRSLCPNNFCDLLTLLNCFSLVLHPGLPPYPPPFFHPDDFSPPAHLIPFLSSRNEWFNGCDGHSLTLHSCRFLSYQFCKPGMSLWMKVIPISCISINHGLDNLRLNN